MIYNLTFSFSDIFYIDATNEQTLAEDLIAIAPQNVDQTADASRRWLASQSDGQWLLLFDNADDVNFDVGRFFPPCASGNILITTRNPDLCFHAGKGGDAKVSAMNHEDAKDLLLRLSREEENSENNAHAKVIAKVLFLLRGLAQTKVRLRNSITFLWPSLKQVLLFKAALH